MNKDEFVEDVVCNARSLGYRIETNRMGLIQIGFGHKKLHEGHLRTIFPQIFQPGANISQLIEDVAPGRPCSHRPMKEILARMSEDISTPSRQ